VSSADYVELVYTFLRENALLVAALAATPDYGERVHGVGTDGADGADPSLSRLMDAVSTALETEAGVHGWGGIDIPIAARVAFCAVLGMTVFDSWVFPGGSRHPGERRIKNELASFLAAGLGGRTEQSEGESSEGGHSGELACPRAGCPRAGRPAERSPG
jgi:hypothetical protein